MKKTLLSALLATIAFATSALAEELSVTDAYAIASTPNAKAGAAFMLIDNATEEDVTLTGATSDFAERVEIHTHKANDEGVMQMMQVEEGIEIPAGSCVLLERGGFHVMFMGANEEWVDGSDIEVTLNFEGHDDIAIEVPIDFEHVEAEDRELPEGRESCASAKMEMDGMDHDNMDHGDMKEGEMDHDHDHDAEGEAEEGEMDHDHDAEGEAEEAKMDHDHDAEEGEAEEHADH